MRWVAEKGDWASLFLPGNNPHHGDVLSFLNIPIGQLNLERCFWELLRGTNKPNVMIGKRYFPKANGLLVLFPRNKIAIEIVEFYCSRGGKDFPLHLSLFLSVHDETGNRKNQKTD